MFFYVDETWQTLGGDLRVGALGAMAIRRDRYNDFSKEFFRIKRSTLGAKELREHELKGNLCFSKRQFERREEGIEAKWLDAADAVLPLLSRFGCRVFGIWTTHPDLLTLRLPSAAEVTQPYKQMMFDFRALMVAECRDGLGSLKFDQRRPSEDAATAGALANWIYRTPKNSLQQSLIGIPDFTVSSVAPGLQIADLIAYLVAFKAAPETRPELEPYLQAIEQNAFEFKYGRLRKRRRTLRAVACGTTKAVPRA